MYKGRRHFTTKTKGILFFELRPTDQQPGFCGAGRPITANTPTLQCVSYVLWNNG